MPDQQVQAMFAKVINLEREVSDLEREVKKANDKLDTALQYLMAFDPVMARLEQAQIGVGR